MNIHGSIGFLGFGNMGLAIAGGLLHQGTVTSSQVLFYDPSPERQMDGRHIGATALKSAGELAAQSATLILAVKPQVMREALREIKAQIQPESLLVSIAAGLPMDWLEAQVGGAPRMARVMPNTPALAGAGASAVAMNARCTEQDKATLETIFDAVGLTVFVEEENLHGVTALSGSGPAYFFRFTELLVEAAVAEGLDRDLAERLAAQTLYGAGKLLHQTEESPADLRAKVTSKGGTTEAAIKAFDEHHLVEVLRAGVHASAARSRELGLQLE